MQKLACGFCGTAFHLATQKYVCHIHVRDICKMRKLKYESCKKSMVKSMQEQLRWGGEIQNIMKRRNDALSG